MKLSSPLVVKVGGSLLDHPQLFSGLRQWLRPQGRPILLVPGGGKVADCVRAWDQLHHLGDVIAHRVALDSLQAGASLFRELFPEARETDQPKVLRSESLNILNLSQFGRSAHIPIGWHVTTDSLAAYAAAEIGAPLVLLKSADLQYEGSWIEAAQMGLVDPHFPEVVDRFSLQVQWINFRAWLQQQTTTRVIA